jgi:hypothetical protein
LDFFLLARTDVVAPQPSRYNGNENRLYLVQNDPVTVLLVAMMARPDADMQYSIHA